MKKLSVITFIAISLFLISYQNSEAVSGSCVGRGGINCLAGPSPAGYLRCYDNSTTSVLYYQTGECNSDAASGCISPRVVGCVNSSQLQELQNNLARNVRACELLQNPSVQYYAGCLFPSLQRQIQICGNEIDTYQIERQVYEQCLSNYYQTILNNVSTTYTAELQKQMNACIRKYGYTWDMANNKCVGTDLLCVMSFGKNSRVFNGASGKPLCFCDSGFVRNAGDTECVPDTSSVAASSSAVAVVRLAVNLGLGAFGNDVVVLQRFLQSKNFLKIPAGVKEGYFGMLTKKAVADFQKSVGLPATGYCGPLTRAIINKQL